MKKSTKEKYLDDIVSEKGNSKETIEDRKSRGNAVLAQMTALLQDILLGNRRVEAGLALRHSWFLNGCLFNSEVWSNFSPQDLQDLEVIDNKILLLITGAQQKSPTEMLFLETAELPLINVISVRRLMYLHTILRRHENEITNRIYQAMKEEPIKGDWIELVKEDLESIDMSIEDKEKIKI
jgi:hypothetical protein